MQSVMSGSAGVVNPDRRGGRTSTEGWHAGGTMLNPCSVEGRSGKSLASFHQEIWRTGHCMAVYAELKPGCSGICCSVVISGMDTARNEEITQASGTGCVGIILFEE